MWYYLGGGMWKGDQNDMWRLEDELRGALLAISQMQGESGWVRRQISLKSRGGVRG